MALTKEKKKELCKEYAQYFEKSVSIVAGHYHNVTSDSLVRLRAKGRVSGVRLLVAKNTLLRIAADKTSYQKFGEGLQGPTMIAMSDEDPGSPARLFAEFAKDNEAFRVYSLAIPNVVYGPEALAKMASLPTKQELYGMVARVLNAPIGKLATALGDNISRVARVLNAVAAAKQAA